ncbi:MAG: 4-hydroxy-tetrahydrodipicolinate reductase [Deltaproteobacteria bacterium]|nr:4-hydroxy-tetrahydrodipicolinate reductase [Deltaproteobacteria bacterium]
MNARAPLRVAIHGVLGRMGRELVPLTLEANGLELVAALDREDSAAQGQELRGLLGADAPAICVTADLARACGEAEVVVDFSAPAALAKLAEVCAQTGTALVTGTTGLDDAAELALTDLSRRVAVVAAPNFSQGVTLLFHLATIAARRLGPDFDAEIVEMHHRHKVDAPSGTAARLAELVAEAKGMRATQALVYGRQGAVGARPDAEVGVLSMRAGDVVGEHTLTLAGEGERLELIHRATDRAIFARGALRAARWAVAQPAGRYDMADVMGLAAD